MVDEKEIKLLSNHFVLSKNRFGEILKGIPSLKAGVIGDVSLDVYWETDMERSELSRETPHYTLPVMNEKCSPGAAGNVAANLKAIGCSQVYVCSVFGDDWRGSLLKRAFHDLDIDLTYSLSSEDWCTPAYCKPIRIGLQNVRQEDPRLDFFNYKSLREDVIGQLVKQLDAMADKVDIIAVTDQFKFGIIGDAIRHCLKGWAAKGKIVLVDSRERIHLFHGMMIKPNELEAAHSFQLEKDNNGHTLLDWAELALRMSREMGSQCFITLGEKGSISADGSDYRWVPSLPVQPPLDTVGAGDCFASGLLASLGSGSSTEEAMAFAHFASAVSIKKLGSTGTASPQEIKEIYDYYEKIGFKN